jgi:hypothetical protein
MAPLLFPLFVTNICYRRLIDEVLGRDSGDKVPMEKVVMLIWQFRDDPQVVTFMTRFVAKVCSICCYIYIHICICRLSFPLLAVRTTFFLSLLFLDSNHVRDCYLTLLYYLLLLVRWISSRL